MQNGGQVLACPPSANIQLYGSSILHPKGKQWFYIFKYASRKPGIWAAKNPDKIGVFAEHIFFMFLLWPARRDSNPRPLESESTAISSFATGGYRRTTESTRSLYTETAANARGNFRFFDFLQKHAPITANGMDFHGFGAKAVPMIPRDSCRRRRFSDGSEIF